MYNNDKEKKLVDTITDNLNSGITFKAFCDFMSHDHRTLQEEFTILCMRWLEKCREMYKEGTYDGRNMYGCKTAKILMDYLDKGEF